MARVVVTRPLPEEGILDLVATHEVEILNRMSLDEDELIAAARDAEGLLTLLQDPITERVIEGCPRLKVIAQFAVGYENIDVQAARREGVIVTHTPGVLTDATADLAMALLLAVARRIVEADRYVRAGRFERWEATELMGMELRGRTLGILGMGRIGLAMARRALGFGMDVLYHNRNPANPTEERSVGAQYVSYSELLRRSDVLSLHCPLNVESRCIVNAGAFSMMKPSAILINTARGAVVDEEALVEALERGTIAGAGLDVYQHEPQVHPRLNQLDNVVLAPHLGSATVETRTQMARMCASAILSVLAGKTDIPHRLT